MSEENNPDEEREFEIPKLTREEAYVFIDESLRDAFSWFSVEIAILQ